MSNHTSLLLLPGNNPDQREWIVAVQEELAPLFSAATVLYYGHWHTDAPYIDFEGELARLGELAQEGPWVVIAKSAGVLLTMMAAARAILVPEKSFFLGAPFSWTRQQGMPVTELLALYPGPAIFIQQTNDPSCSVTELRSLLEASGMQQYRIEQVPGSSHHYGDLSLIKELVRKYLEE